MRQIRIFVSSPGDVGEERRLAAAIIERLRFRYAGRAHIEPIIWEHLPLDASASFQEQIPRPSQADVVIMLLWSRMGTPLPDHVKRPDGTHYASGTEFEFEDALESVRARGLPHLLVYRKTARVTVELTHDESQLLELTRQKRSVDAFIDRWFRGTDGSFTAAFHQFGTPTDFEELLERHLRSLVDGKLAEREGAAGPAPHARLWDQGSPFRGLERFDFEHGLIYFGRTKAIDDVLNLLRRQVAAGCPFVLVFGNSGVGKSSFIRAGVLPFLIDPGVIEGVRVWRRAIFEPSDSTGDLLDGLAAAMLTATALPELAEGATTEAELAGLLRQTPAAAVPLLRNQLHQLAVEHQRKNRLAETPKARLALVVDPLEEIWTRPGTPTEDRQAFVAAIEALSRSGLVYVLGTMRSDFYERSGELPQLLALKAGGGQYHLAPPTPAEIGRMIRMPAQIAGLSFEEDAELGPLDEVLKDAAAGVPGALPLLQFALDEIYKKSGADRTGLLTFAAYHELGGVQGALRTRAEETIAHVGRQLGPRFDAVFAKVFSSVVGLSDAADHAVTRLYMHLDHITADSDSRILVETLINARLFMTDIDDEGKAVVTLAHEALLKHWPRLQSWIEDNRDFLRTRARVAASAERWREEQREPAFLLGEGKPLAEAEDLLARPRGELAPEVVEFVEASREAARAEHLRQRRRNHRIILYVSTAGIVALIFAVVSFFQYRRAEDHRQTAVQEAAAAESARQDEAQQRQSAVRRARAGQELIQFLLEDLRASLKPNEKRDLMLIDEITRRVQRHFETLDFSRDTPEMQREHANNLLAVADIFGRMARLHDAARLAEESLRIREELKLPDHDGLTGTLVALGYYRNQLGEYDQAEALYDRALKINETAHGPDDPAVGELCGRLAELYRHLGRFEEALSLHGRAVRIAERHLPAGQAKLVARYNDLGELLRNMERHAESETYFKKAHAIVSADANADRRRIADVTGNLGVLYYDTGRYEEAEKLLREALEIDLNLLGPDAVYVGADKYKLARVLVATRQFDEARMQLADSERIIEAAVGPNHLRTTKCHEVWAELHLERGEFKEAESRARLVLSVREVALPSPHPELVKALEQLARIADAAGAKDDARRYAEQARAMHDEHAARESEARKRLAGQVAAAPRDGGQG